MTPNAVVNKSIGYFQGVCHLLLGLPCTVEQFTEHHQYPGQTLLITFY